MPSGTWRYDPETDETQYETVDNTLAPVDVIGRQGNQYYVKGGNVIDPLTGGTVATLGQADETVFTANERGTVIGTSPTGIRQLNQPLGEARPGQANYFQRSVSADVTILTATGEASVMSLENIPSAPMGHQVIAYTDAFGNIQYRTAAVGVTSTRQLQALPGYGPSYRLATPEEVAERAIGGYLARNSPAALRDILREQGVADEEIDSAEEQYDLASMFKIDSVNSIQAYSSFWLVRG